MCIPCVGAPLHGGDVNAMYWYVPGIGIVGTITGGGVGVVTSESGRQVLPLL